MSVCSQQSGWLSIWALAAAAFVFVTTEFAPVGLLSAIGNSFGMSSAAVGPMLTVYAWSVSLMSLPMMLLTRNIERRRLLKIALGVLVASHLALCLAPNFTVVIMSRIGTALAHSVFWSITASLAVRLAPAGSGPRALSLLAMGASLAMVLGIPIGRMLGEHLGWRASFAAIGVTAVLIWFLLSLSLPALPSQNSGSLQSLPSLFRRRALISLFCTTALVVTANFTAYTYIEAFVQSVAGFSPQATTSLMLLFGLAGLIGSVCFSWLHARFGHYMLPLAAASLCGCLILMLWASEHLLTLALLFMIWGATMLCLGIQMQSQAIRMAPDATDVASALYSGIYNIGIGAGALLGSVVLSHLGSKWIGYIGATVAALALIVCAWRIADSQYLICEPTE